MSTRRTGAIGWHTIYGWLRDKGEGSFVSWEEYGELTGWTRKSGRAALTRAKRELEVDGLTLGGQSAKGFEVVKL